MTEAIGGDIDDRAQWLSLDPTCAPSCSGAPAPGTASPSTSAPPTAEIPPASRGHGPQADQDGIRVRRPMGYFDLSVCLPYTYAPAGALARGPVDCAARPLL